jgi:hypothetical protein
MRGEFGLSKKSHQDALQAIAGMSAYICIEVEIHGDHPNPAIDDQVKSGHREKA